MRQLTSILAVSTLLLACTSIYLFQQLSAARERAHSEQASEHSLRGKLAELEDIRDGLETDLRAARSAPIPSEPAASPAPPAEPQRGLLTSGPVFRPPEFTRDQQRLMLRHQYRRVFRDLNLSESEMNAALDVLAQQAERNRKQLSTSGAPTNDAQNDQAELAAVLGREKAERFMTEKKLIPVRSEVSVLRMRLEEAGETLSAEQQQALVEVLGKKERTPPPRRLDGDPQQAQECFQTWMQEHNRELRESAAPLLTPKQRELMDEDMVYQNAIRPTFLGAAPTPGAAPPPQAGTPAPPARGP
jgi:hypothetical protein